MKTLATWIAAIAALVVARPLEAHHSISMFDLANPIWVKGTVTRYEPIPPHALITLEERKDGEHVQRWFVEGPPPETLKRTGTGPEFLKVGDVIETCAFALKGEFADRGLLAHIDGSFVHGHVLVMPDGQLHTWGSYGKTDNCVRPKDRLETWVDFLNRDQSARRFWCNRFTAAMPLSASASKSLVDEINKQMAKPCD
jgi:hypothetical protein